VYEASDRLGGRCWSIRGAFNDGQVAEHGGELIDSGHLEIRQLCQELRLPLDNLLQAEPNGSEPLYFFDGRPYTYAEAAADYNGVYQKLHRDVSAASYPTTYAISTPRGRELDKLSITGWIEESVPGGNASRFGRLLDVAYEIEYGAPCADQSSLNLLYLLGYSGQGRLRLFGPSNEKYHVRGGNDLIVTRLAEGLAGRITRERELVAIRGTERGGYDLTFRSPKGTTSVESARRVVLTVPFSVLRATVDLSGIALSDRKRWAIRELGMGSSSKLNVGFTSRHWNALGNNGDTYADTGYQATWEVSRAQPGSSGILVDYTGGRIADSFASGTPASLAGRFLSQLEPVLPGITRRWDGRATVDCWKTNKWTRGSYSFYRVGQYTRFGGAEAEAEGGVHFCGEHTTQDYQGYLNGAVFSGARAASEVLAEA
jgi:monoamine oxidase